VSADDRPLDRAGAPPRQQHGADSPATRHPASVPPAEAAPPAPLDAALPSLRAAAAGPLAARLSPRYLDQHCVLPLDVDAGGALRLAAGAPLDVTVADELTRLFGRPLRVVEMPAGEIQAAVLAVRRGADDAASSRADAGDAEDGDLRALATQAPVVKLVNAMLLDALRAGASDVHVETTTDGLRVRYRLDGVLQDVSRLARQYQAAVVSRIKLVAGLDVAERRRAQDGRARVRVAERDVDLRVSTLPALHGESVVLRILDQQGGARDLAALGMPASVRAAVERLVRRTSGIVIVTGPTGSGKTTTLYAALERINAPGVKIITVEDPVEYQIAGLTQIPVNTRAGITFPTTLRSILRHDPDVIMVGEMRDRETADIAIQAALTGHLVLSTLHTNDAASGVTRLVDMGVEPYLVAATIRGILAQRLVRVLCDRCAEPYAPAPDELAGAPAVAADAPAPRYRRAVGCEHCSGSGYRGRTGIYELLGFGDRARALVTAGAPLAELRALAAREGMVPLSDAAWQLVRAGTTTVDELRRVTADDEVG
jgi:general secretion pathway protein E